MKIYGLADPFHLGTRYIGTTKGDLYVRLAKHVSKRNDGTRRGDWVRSLYDIGKRPIVFEIADVDDAHWAEAEEYWIATYKRMGCDLLNAGTGGPGFRGATQTPEAKRRISLTKRGFRMDAATKQKISEASKGRLKTAPEIVAKVPALFAELGSRKAVAIRLGIDRETVAKILRADAERRGVPPPKGKSAKERARSVEYNHYRRRAAELASDYELRTR